MSFLLFLASLIPFSLPLMNDAKLSTYDSSDHEKAVFVVEAYFLNCPYCNENASQVNDLATYFVHQPRVQVLDVGVDKSDSQYTEWIKRHAPNHPVLKDAKRELIKKLGTKAYPSTYLIDCTGNVRYKSTGVWNETKASVLREEIEDLLLECE